MIKVGRLLYQIDLRTNKLATNEHQQIPIENKLLVINECQDELVLRKIGTNNPYRLGLDAFKKRYQDLQNLIENPEDHKLTPKLSDPRLNKYKVLTKDLPNFMFYIDSYITADKGECKNRVIVANADLVKHADIQMLLKDSNLKPSFEYQETLVDISESELHVYSDGTFTPKAMYISYLRYPQRVRMEGEEDFEGVPTEDQDCELEAYLESELLDLIVSKLASYTENTPAYQNAEIRKQTE